jgi:transcriptional regulator with XRE-family HTH domain
MVKGTLREDTAKRQIHRREVGERLRRWREAVNKRKIDVALDLSISHQRWHNYEMGKRPVDLLLMAELVRADPSFPLLWVVTGSEQQLTPELREALRKQAATHRRKTSQSKR